MDGSKLQFSILQPRSLLKNYIRRILITEGDENTDEIMPIVPTGFAYFTYSRYPAEFNYNEHKFITNDQFYLVGQLEHEKPWFRIKGKFFHVGLELFPLVPFYAFGISGDKLTDTGLSSQSLYELAGEELFIGFRESDNAIIIAEKLQDLLEQRLKNIPDQYPLDKCLDLIFEKRGNISVTDIIERLSVSERNLRRQFKRQVGIGIKKYLKTIQFNSVFEIISSGNAEDIYKTALEYGFYDHAHFINRFNKILNTSPQQFINNPDEFLLKYLGTREKE